MASPQHINLEYRQGQLRNRLDTELCNMPLVSTQQEQHNAESHQQYVQRALHTTAAEEEL